MFTLGGEWLLVADLRNEGREKGYARAIPSDARSAPVPGVIQQVFPACHGVFWYYHKFSLPGQPTAVQRALLRFGAVDYLADVWVNGTYVGGHEGGETPFALDITSALESDAQHLLAVRVLNPCETAIDGYALSEIPHGSKCDYDQYQPGRSYNVGGITLPVTLEVVPVVRITGLFARPQVKTGRVPVAVTVENDMGTNVRGRFRGRVGPAAEGSSLDEVIVSTELPPGESEHELVLEVPQPHLWHIDDPFLYRVAVNLEAQSGDGELRHDFSVRCGFRDFRIVDGFFHLNGRRIFLRSTHTGNHFPIGQVVPPSPDLIRRDLLMARDAGYNMVRFIAGMAYPEQLNFCDEIGLMVYEENLASWLLGDSEQMADRFDRSFREMILRDRNHPSVTIWGMLNETRDGAVFRHAVGALELVRSLDPTRLVLLSSGRWDGQWAIGSVSNPGGVTWEPVWGAEAADAPAADLKAGQEPGGYVRDAGDAHVYPIMPHSPEDARLIRTLGEGGKPVFLSEYGIGSQFNAIDELRRYEQAGAATNLQDVSLIRDEAARFRADLKRFGLENVYPFPEDFLRESYRHSIRQRRFAFDVVRSNPQLCGYNLTGMLDHGLTGEGMWTLWRDWKPGAAECLRQGWAPLRWCLFVDPLHGYADRPLRLEAVLANEQVLRPGTYPARFCLFHEESGTVWEKAAPVHIPEPRSGMEPLAVPVLKQVVRKKLPHGEYTFAACLERGGHAYSDRRHFHLSDCSALPSCKDALEVFGLNARVLKWLSARGYRCEPFDAARRRRGLVLVGEPSKGESAADAWEKLRCRAERGATVAFLSSRPFRTRTAQRRKGRRPREQLPLGEEVRTSSPGPIPSSMAS